MMISSERTRKFRLGMEELTANTASESVRSPNKDP
jgi:hypothetical protein